MFTVPRMYESVKRREGERERARERERERGESRKSRVYVHGAKNI